MNLEFAFGPPSHIDICCHKFNDVAKLWSSHHGDGTHHSVGNLVLVLLKFTDLQPVKLVCVAYSECKLALHVLGRLALLTLYADCMFLVTTRWRFNQVVVSSLTAGKVDCPEAVRRRFDPRKWYSSQPYLALKSSPTTNKCHHLCSRFQRDTLLVNWGSLTRMALWSFMSSWPHSCVSFLLWHLPTMDLSHATHQLSWHRSTTSKLNSLSPWIGFFAPG